MAFLLLASCLLIRDPSLGGYQRESQTKASKKTGMEATVPIDHVLDSWMTLLKKYATNNYSHDEQQAMAAVVQTLETMTAVAAGSERSKSIRDGKNTTARIQVMCWIVIGSGRSHTLSAAQVMASSPHEQLASLRTNHVSPSSSTAEDSRPWEFDVSYLDAGRIPSPLKDIHTIPPSLCTDPEGSTGNPTAKRRPLLSDTAQASIHFIVTNLSSAPSGKKTRLSRGTETDMNARVGADTGTDTGTGTGTDMDTDNVEEQFTLLCIEFARVWSELPPSPETDSLVAHGLLAFLAGASLDPQSSVAVTGPGTGTDTGKCTDTNCHDASRRGRGTGTGWSNTNMTSAALAALLPLALQQCDRYALSDQAVGLVVLWEVLVRRSTSSLLAATGAWLLPLLHKVFLAVPASFASAETEAETTDPHAHHCSTNAVIVVASRVLQALIVANQSSPIGSHYAHLLVQRVEYKVTMTLDPTAAWPLLLALQPFVAHCSPEVLCCHLQSTVDMLLAMINRWHTPLQVACVQLLYQLVDRCLSLPLGALPILPQIIVELFRVEIFLLVGSSDITGVAVSDPSGPVVSALRQALRALSTLLRFRYPQAWEDTLKVVGLIPTDHDDIGGARQTKADEEWNKTLVQCADHLVGDCNSSN